MPGSGGSERTLMKRICLFPAYTVLAAFVAAIAFSGCQNINVDTERLLPPVVSNGRTDGRFVIGTSDTVTITDPNDGAVIKYTVDGGPEQTYSAPIGLTDDATIAALLEIKWWDWDAGKITRNLSVITSPDISALKQAT